MRTFLVGMTCGSLALIAGLSFSKPTIVQATSAADQPPTATRIGYVRVAEIHPRMVKFKVRSEEMNKRRNDAGQKLSKMKADLEGKKSTIQTAAATVKPGLEAEVVTLQKAFEDAERTERMYLDTDSMAILRELHADITKALKEMAKERNLDVVHGMPPLPTDQAAKGSEQLAMNLFFRPCSVNVLYIRDGVDLTDDLLDRVNDRFREEREKKGDK